MPKLSIEVEIGQILTDLNSLGYELVSDDDDLADIAISRGLNHTEALEQLDPDADAAALWLTTEHGRFVCYPDDPDDGEEIIKQIIEDGDASITEVVNALADSLNTNEEHRELREALQGREIETVPDGENLSDVADRMGLMTLHDILDSLEADPRAVAHWLTIKQGERLIPDGELFREAARRIVEAMGG